VSRFSGLSGFSIAALANRINISVSYPIKKNTNSYSECIFRLGLIVIVSGAPTSSHHHHHHPTERVGARIQYISAANLRSEGAPPRERERESLGSPATPLKLNTACDACTETCVCVRPPAGRPKRGSQPTSIWVVGWLVSVDCHCRLLLPDQQQSIVCQLQCKKKKSSA
jgi:hypothetical protein